jgi:nitrogen fixation NifU-like protein
LFSVDYHHIVVSIVFLPAMASVSSSMPSEQDIYEEHVLDHYEDPYNRGELASATHGDEGKNPLCGDVVQVSLRLDSEGKIAEAFFDGHGCVISQASASMLMEAMEGKTPEEVKEFTAEQMLELFGPQLTPNRQKCCLLPWRVLQSAMHSPLIEDEDGDEAAHFSGPSLSEEN